MKAVNNLLIVLVVAFLLALTACGREEKFYQSASAGQAKIPGSDGHSNNDTNTDVSQPDESKQASSSSSSSSSDSTSSSSSSTSVTPSGSSPIDSSDNSVPPHCTDGKGKDGEKNKHCK